MLFKAHRMFVVGSTVAMNVVAKGLAQELLSKKKNVSDFFYYLGCQGDEVLSCWDRISNYKELVEEMKPGSEYQTRQAVHVEKMVESVQKMF